jgi:hypothetical protein
MDPDLNKAITESRKLRERERVRNKRDNRGRPIKNSGIYYNLHMLVSPKLMLTVRRNRLPGEPLGAALDRLFFSHQKKVEASQRTLETPVEPLYMTDNDVFNRLWDFYDDSKEAAETR